MLFFLLFACAANANSNIESKRNRRVVVIGAGIGGGAFSYYWRKMHPEDDLVVFENRDYIGGRLKHVVMHGQVVELGGDAWSTAVNEYVVALAKEFGLQRLVKPRFPSARLSKKEEPVGDPMKSSMGVWQGDHIEPISHIVLRDPLSDMKAGLDEVNFIRSLRENYRQRGSTGIFQSVEEFLSVADLHQYTSVSSAEFFGMPNPLSMKHISHDLLQFALEPLTRVIYDQNLSESHAFASLVAVTAAVGAASFDGGNSLLVENLLNSSRAEVRLSTRVADVSYQQHSDSYTVRSCSASDCKDEYADVVILACPMEHARISFQPAVKLQQREWRHWYVTVTRARGLNPVFFNATRDEVEQYDNILTTDNSSSTIPFNVLQLVAELGDGTSLWKFFSNQDISTQLPSVFEGWSSHPADTVVEHWPYTFPVLRPVAKGGSEKYQPIVLGPRLIYLNSMESVASAMEGSIIAARNAVLLLSRHDLSGEEAISV